MRPFTSLLSMSLTLTLASSVFAQQAEPKFDRPSAGSQDSAQTNSQTSDQETQAPIVTVEKVQAVPEIKDISAEEKAEIKNKLHAEAITQFGVAINQDGEMVPVRGFMKAKVEKGNWYFGAKIDLRPFIGYYKIRAKVGEQAEPLIIDAL